MSINEYIKDCYRASKIHSSSRHERLLYTKNQFLKKYGDGGLKKYFNGSNKKLYLEISELTKGFAIL